MFEADTPRRRRVRRLAPADPDCVVGYLRCSTEEQAMSGLGLAAQRATIRAECERRSWKLCAVYVDEGVSGKVKPGKPLDYDKPALAAALQALERGEAGTLVVAKLDRLTRSLGALCDVLDLSQRQGWAMVACDLAVDTSTPMGKAIAQIAGTFAELERELIGQRTRDALAVKRAQGVRLGRPPTVSNDARARIVELRADGLAWRKIAETMNAEQRPTAQPKDGASWHANTVRRIALGTR